MRRLELGEAWAKEDYARIGEITEEMQRRGVNNIGYEHQRAQSEYGQFEAREERRNEQRVLFEPVPAGQQPAAPEQEAIREPVRTYADLQREHAEIVTKAQAPEQSEGLTETQEQRAPEQRRPRFYEDLKQEHANAIDKDKDQAETREQAPGEAGAKKLAFYEDRNPSQSHELEH